MGASVRVRLRKHALAAVASKPETGVMSKRTNLVGIAGGSSSSDSSPDCSPPPLHSLRKRKRSACVV